MRVSYPEVPAQITIIPPRSHTKFDVGIVSSPGGSDTIRGLVFSPAASQIAFPNAFAPASHSAHSGASHRGGTPQWLKSFRLIDPTAPSDRQYSAFSAEPTTAIARPPALATSWIASDPRPPP